MSFGLDVSVTNVFYANNEVSSFSLLTVLGRINGVSFLGFEGGGRLYDAGLGMSFYSSRRLFFHRYSEGKKGLAAAFFVESMSYNFSTK
jgi:hypothetical protein